MNAAPLTRTALQQDRRTRGMSLIGAPLRKWRWLIRACAPVLATLLATSANAAAAVAPADGLTRMHSSIGGETVDSTWASNGLSRAGEGLHTVATVPRCAICSPLVAPTLDRGEADFALWRVLSDKLGSSDREWAFRCGVARTRRTRGCRFRSSHYADVEVRHGRARMTVVCFSHNRDGRETRCSERHGYWRIRYRLRYELRDYYCIASGGDNCTSRRVKSGKFSGAG